MSLCFYCKGSGKDPHKKEEECFACEGQGEKLCLNPECFGGKLREKTGGYVRLIRDCPDCGGTGNPARKGVR